MTKTAMRTNWTMVTLLAAALALPGLALAHNRDGYRTDRDDRGYAEWRHNKPRDYWRHHRHTYRSHGKPVVVIRQPVHVEPHRPAPPPPWVPLAIGIGGLLHGH